MSVKSARIKPASFSNVNAQLAQIAAIISDTTFNNSWIAGTASADPATDRITLTSHGLAAGDPVEFGTGTGILPSGLLAHDYDTIGGMYYNVLAVIDANTFTVTSTVGGSVAVDITDSGTSGWQIRKAGLTWTSISGLNLDLHNQYEIFIMGRYCRKTATVADSAYFQLNNVGTYKYFLGASWAPSAISNQAFTNKFSSIYHCLTLRKISATQILINIVDNGQQSDNKSAATNISGSAGCLVVTNGTNITSITYGIGSGGSRGYIRNGTRVVVVRRA